MSATVETKVSSSYPQQLQNAIELDPVEGSYGIDEAHVSRLVFDDLSHDLTNNYADYYRSVYACLVIFFITSLAFELRSVEVGSVFLCLSNMFVVGHFFHWPGMLFSVSIFS